MSSSTTNLNNSMNTTNNTFNIINQNIKNVGDSANQTSMGIGSLARALATGFVATKLIGYGKDATEAFGSFEQGMANVNSVTKLTESQFEQLSEQARKVGKDTGLGAAEATKGMEELVKAGVPLKDILGSGLKDALDLTIAGEISAGEAASIASTALNAFKKDNLSIASAANILAGAANASATSVSEMKYGLSMASAVASGVGLTFQDTNTALAVFAQNGLKGSDAGTSLKTMLLNLQPATENQFKVFQKLGLYTEETGSAFYDMNGKIKPLGQIADLLKTKLAHLTDAQRQQALEMMFGTDAIRAGNIMFNEGAIGFSNMMEEMSKVTAAETAAKKMDTLKGSIKYLKAEIQDSMISIADDTGLAQMVRDTAETLKKHAPEIKTTIINIMNGFGTVFGFLSGHMEVIGPLIIGLVTAFASFKIINGVMSTFKGLSTTMAILTSPIGLVALGIGALVGVFIYAYNHSETFRKATDELIQKLVAFAVFLNENLGPIFSAIFEGMKNIFMDQIGIIQSVIQGVMKSLGGVIDFLTGVFTGDWERAWTGIKEIFTGIWDAIKGTFSGLGKMLGESINTVIGIANTVPGIDIPLIAIDSANQSSSGESSWAGSGESDWSAFASGTVNAPGGVSLVGEKGPELMNIKSGASITNANATERLLSNSGGSNITMPSVQIIIQGNTDDSTVGKIKAELEKHYSDLRMQMGLTS